jgi:hypothetical protein
MGGGRQVLIGLVALGLAAAAVAVWYYSEEAPLPSIQPEEIARQAGRSERIRSHVLPAGGSGSPPSSISKKRMVGAKAFALDSEQPIYDGPADEYVNALLAASVAGDAASTYRIYLRVSSCRQALSQDAESDLPMYEKMGMAESYLRSREKSLDQCSSLVGNKGIMSGNWLAKAAEQGSMDARIMYAIDVDAALGQDFNPIADPEKIMAYKSTAMHYLLGVAAEGNVNALSSLSGAYENGILTRRDMVSSYAYDLVLRRVNPAYVSDLVEEEKRRQLSDSQMRTSRQLAGQIYEQCCVEK